MASVLTKDQKNSDFVLVPAKYRELLDLKDFKK